MTVHNIHIWGGSHIPRHFNLIYLYNFHGQFSSHFWKGMSRRKCMFCTIMKILAIMDSRIYVRGHPKMSTFSQVYKPYML